MNILLTNDDGIGSEGLLKLADVLRSRLGHRVYVIAPDVDRSGVSHGISILNGPVKLSARGEDTWRCSGLPADCVIVAMLGGLEEKPDLVLSGINRGANLGTDLVYSGTAAAARQASIMGVPAIALSLNGSGVYHWDMAVSWSADHLEELAALWEENTFLNVNIPNTPAGPEGMVITRPVIKHYNDKMSMVTSRGSTRWCFLEYGQEVNEPGEGTDHDAVSRNFVSISTVCNQPAVKKIRS